MADFRARDDGAHVVVTGTSTGIGAASALLLAELGFRVFAGVRSDADGEALVERASGRLTPISIEITDEESIAAAAETVTSAVGGRGLFGLVNNAGIVRPGPLELQALPEFRHHLEVNLVGPVAMIQAFLPLIRLGRGRIVNVGSIGGRLALPLHGAYSASKFGMEAVSDALRLELRQWRIPVSHVDPGATQTPIFDKTLAAIDELEKSLRSRNRSEYVEQISGVRRLIESTAADAAPVDELAKTVAKALTADKPKSRYRAGHGATGAVLLARMATDGVKDRAVVYEAKLSSPG
ncbi:MAG: SDR family NAD(P)-dependent oxidoreductase [Solirubrobacterales bacterium]